MKRPPSKTMFVGHPLVATPIMFASTIGMFASLYNDGGTLPVAICSMVAMAAGRAHAEASAYTQWKVEWDAMAGLPDYRPGRRKAIRDTVMALALLVGGVVIWQVDTDTRTVLLGWAILLSLPMLVVIALLAMIRSLRRRAKPTRSRRTETVTVVAQTTLPPPTLAAAYAALPVHCRQVLGGPQ